MDASVSEGIQGECSTQEKLFTKFFSWSQCLVRFVISAVLKQDYRQTPVHLRTKNMIYRDGIKCVYLEKARELTNPRRGHWAELSHDRHIAERISCLTLFRGSQKEGVKEADENRRRKGRHRCECVFKGSAGETAFSEALLGLRGCKLDTTFSANVQWRNWGFIGTRGDLSFRLFSSAAVLGVLRRKS